MEVIILHMGFDPEAQNLSFLSRFRANSTRKLKRIKTLENGRHCSEIGLLKYPAKYPLLSPETLQEWSLRRKWMADHKSERFVETGGRLAEFLNLQHFARPPRKKRGFVETRHPLRGSRRYWTTTKICIPSWRIAHSWIYEILPEVYEESFYCSGKPIFEKLSWRNQSFLKPTGGRLL